MSKVNPRVKPKPKMDFEARLAGGAGAYAAVQTDIALLRRAVLANLLWEDVAYMDGAKVADEIKRLIPLCKPEDVAALTVEARKMQKLRHTPLFLASEMCKHEGTKPYVRETLSSIVTRADMLTDFLAIYWKNKKVSLASQAKKGLADAFHNFNEYKLAKYDRDGAIKLRDVMFLCHPKPRNEYETSLFKKVAERKLAVPETWETMLSAGKDKKETWTYLIEEGKIGGLAMLRNIRNMRQAGVDRRVIEKGLKDLKSSMLLPLNFLAAADENPEFKRQIEDAMLESYANLPKLTGKTLFIVDVSGSMYASISEKSKYNRLKTAAVMAMLAANQCEDFELVCTAGSDARRVHSSEHIKYASKGFDLIEQILGTYSRLGGGGIFTRQCLEWCYENVGKKFDRIIVFSDSQDCDWPDKRTPKPYGKYNYICDVSAHTRGVNYKGIWTAEVSGWSEHFLTFIAAVEGLDNLFTE